jgi:hypothetical protein
MRASDFEGSIFDLEFFEKAEKKPSHVGVSPSSRSANSA